jgi:GT2 family glycosyltransferase
MKKIGLVTVLYKSDEVLEDFIKSISVQSFKNYHLYIIDNSPSDETDFLLDTLIAKYPVNGFSHIKNPSNYGVAQGNNQGIKLSLENDCDYILLLNNDIDFPNVHLFEEMINCAVARGEDLIIPKILYYGTRKIWLAGGKIHKFRGYASHVGYNEDDSGRHNNDGYFEYAPTCFMLISRKVFDAIGFMDENYFVYCDDSDFILRAVNKGFRIYYMPSIEVFHKVSFSTGGAMSLFSIYYLNRNRVYFIRKNYSFPVKHIALAHTIVTRMIRFLMYKKGEKKELFRAVKDGFLLRLKTEQ